MVMENHSMRRSCLAVWEERTINSFLSKDALTLEHHPVVIIHGVHLLNRLCEKYPHKPEGNSSYDLFLLPPSEKSNV